MMLHFTSMLMSDNTVPYAMPWFFSPCMHYWAGEAISERVQSMIRGNQLCMTGVILMLLFHNESCHLCVGQ